MCEVSDPKDWETFMLSDCGVKGRLGREGPVTFVIVEVTVSIVGHGLARAKPFVLELPG